MHHERSPTEDSKDYLCSAASNKPAVEERDGSNPILF